VTKLDVYLDTSWAAFHPDVRFDWLSSINDSHGDFLRDFAFNAGTTPSDYSGTPGFVVNAATNSGRDSSYPSNTCPSPSDAPNACRAPVYITQSGWYTFEHIFTNAAGTLSVEMKILDSSGTTMADWTIYADPMTNVGGPRYGYFTNEEFDGLPVDNASLTVSPPAKDATCTGTLDPFAPGYFTGTAHNLTIPPGNACVLEGATITNDVNVGKDATLGAENSWVGHNVNANAPYEIETGNNGPFYVGNDFKVNGADTPNGGQGYDICDTTVGHNLSFTNTLLIYEINIGDLGPSAYEFCSYSPHGQNSIGNDLIVTGNSTGRIDIGNNSVGHDLTVSNNKATTATGDLGDIGVDDNEVGRYATCQGNSPALSKDGSEDGANSAVRNTGCG
jgi:hypothetical protein